MKPIPSRQKPAFLAIALGLVLALTWVYDFLSKDSSTANLVAVGIDVLLLLVLIFLWSFFFSQLILPVRRLDDRWQIWRHLWLHVWNRHGGSVFIENGRKSDRGHMGLRGSSGVAYVDSASAAVTRNTMGPKQILGPGVHFLGDGEQVVETFSLHNQTYSVGPAQDEPVFGVLPAHANDEERQRFATTQNKRRMVSGLTRDGNEVVPEIRILFRLDGEPARPGAAGSRFGFHADAVRRAARGQGMNVDPISALRSNVSWNQLPGLIAVDLWREYLGRFTLDELFNPIFRPVPEVLQPEEPVDHDTYSVEPSVQHGKMGGVLRTLNDGLEARLNRKGMLTRHAPGRTNGGNRSSQRRQLSGRSQTALHVVEQMVRNRMTQAVVADLDDCGRYLKSHSPSQEFKRLRERGLRVLEVSIGGYRFDPAVEEQIVSQWRSGWLTTGTSEREKVEQLEALAAESGRQRALLEHAESLGRALRSHRPASIPQALSVMIKASHDEILADERLHGRGSDELSDLATLSKWVESPGE